MSYSAEVLNELAPEARAMLNIPKDHYTGLIIGFGYPEIEYARGVQKDRSAKAHRYTEEKKEATGKYVCSICGYVYDPAEHDGAAFEDLQDDWGCPHCKQPKAYVTNYDVLKKAEADYYALKVAPITSIVFLKY